MEHFRTTLQIFVILSLCGTFLFGGTYAGKSAVPLQHKSKVPPQNKNEVWEGKSLTEEEDLSLVKLEPGPDYRLPMTVVPLSYNLRLRPIFDAEYPGIGSRNTAPGEVVISVLCKEDTNAIVLHAKVREVNEASILVTDSTNRTAVGVISVDYDTERDFLIIRLSEQLSSGVEYDVSIDFVANVPPNDSVRGLYSEEYFDPITNQTKFMAVTQLEPLRARQVFPCFDEPTHKTVFNVVIGRTENFTALANAPLNRTDPDGEHQGWFWDTFNTSVPMPTYLFAIGISNYSYAESGAYRMPVKVHGPSHLVLKGEMDLAAELSALLMEYFEYKYKTPYPATKLDSISVPHKRGAMENYGLVSYGEFYLQYNEYTTTVELRRMVNIIAHELGHQWFGNLVTCKWWSNIWLNEGFASYVSFASIDEMWPFLDMTSEWLGSVNNALIYDASPSSHPVHQEAYSADQISQNMDTIGYDKGASLVRMMVSFLGEEIFNTGIREYLRKYQNSVVEQDDLFTELNDAVNRAGLELPTTVNDIMHSWTLQKGFPLVRVSIDESSNTLIISQEPWGRNDTSGTTWDIPVKYILIENSAVKETGSFWLLKDGQPKNITLKSVNEWIILNTGAGGFYRTVYDDSIYQRRMSLGEIPELLSPDGKVRLLDDQYNLAFEGRIPIQNALNSTRLDTEDDPAVWLLVLRHLEKLKNFYRRLHFESEEEGRDLPALEKFLDSGLSRQFHGIPENVHDEYSSRAVLRGQVFSWFCDVTASPNDLCENYTDRFLRDWENNSTRNPIPNDLQQAAYCTSIEYHERSFDWLLEQYFSSNSDVEKQRLSAALGCSQNLTQIEELFQKTVFANENDERKIEKAHTLPMFQNLVLRSFVGHSKILEVFRLTPEAIPDYYDRDVDVVVQIFSMLSYVGCTQTDLNLLIDVWRLNSAFFRDALNQIEIDVENNMSWLRQYRENITDYLIANPSTF